MSKIISRRTREEFPDFPWCAYRADDHQNHRGYGFTKLEALADLARLDDERAECEATELELCPHGRGKAELCEWCAS